MSINLMWHYHALVIGDWLSMSMLKVIVVQSIAAKRTHKAEPAHVGTRLTKHKNLQVYNQSMAQGSGMHSSPPHARD